MAALEQLEVSLGSLRAGLVELEVSPSYLMLLDAEPSSDTGRRYQATVTNAADLWPLIDAAAEILGAARRLLHEGGRRPDRQRLAELVFEPWHRVELGSGQAEAVAAPTLLAQIRKRYDSIREAVSDIDERFRSILPRVEAARATLERLAAEADELDVPEPLIGRARALADDLKERLVTDPASVHLADGNNLDLLVAEAAKQVASLRTAHDNLDTDLGATEELLASLRVLRARAEAARTQALAKVSEPDGLVRVPGAAVLDGPDGLAARLDRLFETAAGAGWLQQRGLLDGWLTGARKLEAQLVRAGEANRAPLEARDELRGRLRAYEAKMAATGRAEDLGLVELADRARSVLYSAPTDLGRAETAIGELAARLRA